MGVLIFEGMTVGVLPGDFSISINEAGGMESKLILSTVYNVIPIWLRIAADNLMSAKMASGNLSKDWVDNPETQKSLLIAELTPSMQVIIACGIALDALYDMLRPYAKLSESDISSWKSNKTGRAKQITEVIRRVYRLDRENFDEFKRSISQIIKFRDLGVHPSLELKNSCTRPDLSLDVDWKFSAYRFSNANNCFESTMKMMIHLLGRTCSEEKVDAAMKNIFLALQELGVVETNPQVTSGYTLLKK